MSIKPRTRKEVFLEALAKGEPVSVTPRTREEIFLAEQAKRESEGGSGSGSNEESKPVKFTASLDNASSGNLTVDFTFTEVENSIKEGKEPVLALSYKSTVFEFPYSGFISSDDAGRFTLPTVTFKGCTSRSSVSDIECEEIVTIRCDVTDDVDTWYVKFEYMPIFTAEEIGKHFGTTEA